MQTLWCWRCEQNVPMLDEAEFEVVSEAHRQGVQAVQAYRKQYGATLQETPTDDLLRPVRNAYARLTGASGFDADHILKHRLSLYGPPCVACGKPLRTPHASRCAACGTPAQS